MMRVVLDTNVLVSGFIRPSGAPGRVLEALRDGRFPSLYSRAMLEELVDVLARPWLQEKYGIRDVDVEALLKLLLLRGEEVIPKREIHACRDPRDDKFLEVAAAGGTDFLVTGDDDLRSIGQFERIRIIGPAELLARLPGEGEEEPG